MADLNRKANTAAEMNEQEAAEVGGGFIYPEKYYLRWYIWSGISIESHHFWFDKYTIRGVKISKKTADAIALFHQQNGRKPTDEELRTKFKVKL